MEMGKGIPPFPFPNQPPCSFSARVCWVFGDSGRSLKNKSIYLRREKAGVLYTPPFFIIHSPFQSEINKSEKPYSDFSRNNLELLGKSLPL
jgi:hypothetical protein